ncbi:hypothetical protein LGM45_02400 [Burkholderia cepacia]|uniref:hypothetical protein n=1 Tax=Burkholderia cepacia TaxID=292 RepID=UPI001CF57ABE|nr:hypothetical protein [Burkholderia cepacia]MCA7927870.1 hypothetical protein [Burkholderia cepacia]
MSDRYALKSSRYGGLVHERQFRVAKRLSRGSATATQCCAWLFADIAERRHDNEIRNSFKPSQMKAWQIGGVRAWSSNGVVLPIMLHAYAIGLALELDS